MSYTPAQIAEKFEVKARTLTSDALLNVIREFIRMELYNDLFDIACGILIDRNAGYGVVIETLMDI
jgi:hypothetical protein